MIDLESHSQTQGLQRADKRSVAIVSIVAVVLLGIAKLVIGLLTGSLGLIADAIHSGVDFVSALLALLAVRWADRPPDWDHPYGHGRAENLAAFVQVLLLIGTALWLAYQAVQRIVLGEGVVQPTPMAFLVLLLSIGVSAWRSGSMARAASQHGSAALAAGALDFRMDIWSSTVVLVGLVIEAVDHYIGLPDIFATTDALAGLIVAGLVIVTASNLARETIDALVDRSPLDVAERMAEMVARVPGVLEVRRMRLRRADGYFADVVAVAPRTIGLPESEGLTEAIERAVGEVDPRTDVVVRLIPGVDGAETVVDRVHLLARELGVRAHDVQVRQVDGRLDVNLHVEVDPSLSLEDAHALASDLERRISMANARIRDVNTHLEIKPPEIARRLDVTRHESGLVRQIQVVATNALGPECCHEVRVYRPTGRGKERDVVLHCVFVPTMPVGEAHQRAERLEQALRARIPGLGSVLVHVEPMNGADGAT